MHPGGTRYDKPVFSGRHVDLAQAGVADCQEDDSIGLAGGSGSRGLVFSVVNQKFSHVVRYVPGAQDVVFDQVGLVQRVNKDNAGRNEGCGEVFV